MPRRWGFRAVTRSITWGLGLIQRHVRDRGASTAAQSSGDHKSAAASASIERLLFLPRVQDRVKDAIDDDTRAGDKGDSKYDSDGSSSSGSGGEEEGSSAALAFLLQPIQQEKLHVWVLLMLLLEVFVATFVPVSVVFGDGQSAFSKVTDVVVAVAFAVDLCAKLLQSRTNAFGERVPPGKGAAWMYIRSFWFIVDAVACLPLFVIPVMWNSAQSVRLVFLVKCFWFFRMEDAFPWLAHLNLLYAALWRIGRLGIMLVLLSHWTGCLWFGVSDSQTVAGYDLPWTHVTPVFDGGPPISESSTLDQYVVSLNVGLFLLMGESINFQTRAEYLLAFCCLVVGAFMYGSVLGQMAAYVESMISVASRSAQQIDQVDSIMRKIGLPADVQRRVHSFYDYMYRVHGVSSPAEEVAFLKDLTPNLKLQIMIHKCKAVISNCPLFTTMPAMFRLELLNGLQHCVFMPGDYVCQIGSVAKDVYFVSEGQVFVLDKNNRLIALLTRGDYFGEVPALLNLRRMAKTMAVTWCELLRLDYDVFQRILEDFPHEAAILRKSALERCQRSDTIADVEFVDTAGEAAQLPLSASAKRRMSMVVGGPSELSDDGVEPVVDLTTQAHKVQATAAGGSATAVPTAPLHATPPAPPPLPTPLSVSNGHDKGADDAATVSGDHGRTPAVAQQLLDQLSQQRSAILCQLDALRQQVERNHMQCTTVIQALLMPQGTSRPVSTPVALPQSTSSHTHVAAGVAGSGVGVRRDVRTHDVVDAHDSTTGSVGAGAGSAGGGAAAEGAAAGGVADGESRRDSGGMNAAATLHGIDAAFATPRSAGQRWQLASNAVRANVRLRQSALRGQLRSRIELEDIIVSTPPDSPQVERLRGRRASLQADLDALHVVLPASLESPGNHTDTAGRGSTPQRPHSNRRRKRGAAPGLSPVKLAAALRSDGDGDGNNSA